MTNLEAFLLALLMVSVFTGLVTEAVKKVMAEFKIQYHANTLAGVVAVILAAAVSAAITILSGAQWDAKMAVCSVALMVLSWLCAMVGYDKVVQAIAQFRTGRREEDVKDDGK